MAGSSLNAEYLRYRYIEYRLVSSFLAAIRGIVAIQKILIVYT